MRNTGGEGLLSVLDDGNAQNGANYAHVRNYDDREGDQQNKQGKDKVKHLYSLLLSTREIEQRADVTVEVVDDI